MLEFNQERKYRIRLLPNIHNLKENIKILKGLDKNYPDKEFSLYLSYVLFDGSVQIARLSKNIIDWNYKLMMGEVSINSNGLLLGGLEVECYGFNSDGELLINEQLESSEDIKKYTDITKLSNPFSIVDIKSEYELEFDSVRSETPDLYHKKNFKLIKTNPLYKAGDDKNKIIDMYKSINTIDQTILDYIKDKKEKYPSFIFGDEAIDYSKTYKLVKLSKTFKL